MIPFFSLLVPFVCIVKCSLQFRFLCDSMCTLVSVTQYEGVCASLRNVSTPVSCLDISRQPQLCAKRYCTVGVDSLACVCV